MKLRSQSILNHAALRVAVALGCGIGILSSLACSSKTTPAMAAEHTQDSIRLEPGNARLKYIKVTRVEETDAAPSVRLTGKVGFNEDATQRVASPIDGRATRIMVELGDKVRPGQALLELTSPHVSELQANAQKFRQDLDVATKALGRTTKLKQDGAVSEKEAAQAEADYRKAKADAARGEAQLRSLSVSPTDPATSAALRAQIGGVVVERNVLVGQEVRADSAQPLFTISNLNTVWVQADVYEQDLGLVHKGDAIEVHVPAYPTESFDGKVDHVGDVLDPVSRTVKLRCSVPNRDQMLKPEMFAKVELTDIAGKKAVLLPAAAILTDSEHTRVLVAGNDNLFRPRIVTIGPEFDGNVRVLSGLKLGEQIVTEGAIFLKREMDSN
jgi:cobalt-zinc-cadmium efflux system membrane fusion protein